MGHRRAVQALPSTQPEIAVALAWQPVATRAALAALFALDARLAGVVARVTEPLLAQVRLAWWRERLSGIADGPTIGEPLLEQLATSWNGDAVGLGPLVDGWESLIGESPLPSGAIANFAAGRGSAFAAFAALVGEDAGETAARHAGASWAMADLAAHSPDARDRGVALALGREVPFVPIRSRALRGFGVLGGLARRALERDEPIMHGRGAALAAIRLGMFGR